MCQYTSRIVSIPSILNYLNKSRNLGQYKNLPIKYMILDDSKKLKAMNTLQQFIKITKIISPNNLKKEDTKSYDYQDIWERTQ